MTGPVEWLQARLDEDERNANIISSGGYAPTQWRAEPVTVNDPSGLTACR